MGTNYYLVKKVDREEIKKRITEAIDSLNDFELIQTFDNIEFFAKEAVVHIGKSSYGWKFLFNHNDEKYYKKNRESINQFIRSGTLYNEYYEVVSPEAFWDLVDSKKDGMGDKEYNEKHPEYRAFIGGALNDFYSDGLRFSTDTEFS